MATEIVMPRLDWSSETGSLVAWAKRDGDEVRAGEILVTVEGDKAAVEVEAMDSGILRIPPDSPTPGVEVPVGTVKSWLHRSLSRLRRTQHLDGYGGPAAVGATRPAPGDQA